MELTIETGQTYRVGNHQVREFTINKIVQVAIALDEPDEGWIAGNVVKLQETALAGEILDYIGFRRFGGGAHGRTIDVPNYLWHRYYDRLAAIGVPLEEREVFLAWA